MPGWAKWILWVVVVLVILVILKVNLNIGAGGFSLTQGLVH